MPGGEQTQPEYDESADTTPAPEPEETWPEPIYTEPDPQYSPEVTVPASPSEFIDTSDLEDTRHYPNEETPDIYWQEKNIREGVDEALDIMDANYQMPRDSFNPISMGFERGDFGGGYYGRGPTGLDGRIVFNPDVAFGGAGVGGALAARQSPFSRFMASSDIPIHEMGHWMDENIAQPEGLNSAIANTPLEKSLQDRIEARTNPTNLEPDRGLEDWAIDPAERFARVFEQKTKVSNEGDPYLNNPHGNPTGLFADTSIRYNQGDMDQISPYYDKTMSPFTRFSPTGAAPEPYLTPRFEDGTYPNYTTEQPRDPSMGSQIYQKYLNKYGDPTEQYHSSIPSPLDRG